MSDIDILLWIGIGALLIGGPVLRWAFSDE